MASSSSGPPGTDSDPAPDLGVASTPEDTGSNNYTGFKNEEADGIFEKLKLEFDSQERIKLYHRWYEIQYDGEPLHLDLVGQVGDRRER